MNSLIKSLIFQKRIALVGPSKHLMGTNAGKIIDSYDVVCRVGEFYPHGMEKDYGSRTDIFIGAFNDQTPKTMKYEFELARKNKIDIEKQIKLVICPQYSKDVHSGKDLEENFKEVGEFKENNIPFVLFGNEEFKKFREEIGIHPTTGIAIFPILLSHAPEEIFVTGYSFYQKIKGTNGESYRDGYFGKTHPNPGSMHNQIGCLNYFKKILQQNFNIRIDSRLYEILNLPNFKNVENIG